MNTLPLATSPNLRPIVSENTVFAPATWASAFINGDTSGIESDPVDFAAYREFSANLRAQGLQVVDVVRDEAGEPDAPFFSWQSRMWGSPYTGSEIQDFVVARA